MLIVDSGALSPCLALCARDPGEFFFSLAGGQMGFVTFAHVGSCFFIVY